MTVDQCRDIEQDIRRLESIERTAFQYDEQRADSLSALGLYYISQLRAVEQERDELRHCLQLACGCIKIFHGPSGWNEYLESPEMTRFVKALKPKEGARG